MADARNENLFTLAGSVEVTAAGKFQILAITAGVGNGWNFPADVLKRSLPLWEGVECFVDHRLNPSGGHSVRDLGGNAPARSGARKRRAYRWNCKPLALPANWSKPSAGKFSPPARTGN